jgi:hypothetical protein
MARPGPQVEAAWTFDRLATAAILRRQISQRERTERKGRLLKECPPAASQ